MFRFKKRKIPKVNSKSRDESEEFNRFFTLYSKIGNSGAGNTMSLQAAKLWFVQAQILDESKGITETDVEETFSAAHATGMDKNEFKFWIEILAKKKNKDAKDLMNKLVNFGSPAAGNRSELLSMAGKIIKP